MAGKLGFEASEKEDEDEDDDDDELLDSAKRGLDRGNDIFFCGLCLWFFKFAEIL